LKRVLCLYRVSTKGQVDLKDDIPMQRRECMAFIEKHPDWLFVGERLEKGVSGFKVSASKRDAIIEIRGMAERGEFDILLVFMFDRLGRREDETPFLVEWFVGHGIEVWSTVEGQQKIENRSDKLINYIRYWMAGGESEKTSMRVKAAHQQMVEDGIWRGGKAPYGYRLVMNGRVNKKHKALYDLEIDPETAPIVQEIFKLVIRDGYGTYRIANYLNGKYDVQAKMWSPRTILVILRNPIYTGRMHMNDVTSEPNETLRLINDDDFAFAQYVLKGHIQQRFALDSSEDRNSDGGVKSKTATVGASLLAGILYCGHCGHKLIGTYCTKQRANGPYHRPVYRCYHGSIKARHCGGQTIYSARKIEEAVSEVVRSYFDSMNVSIDSLWREQVKRQMRNKSSQELHAAESILEKLRKQEKALRKELLLSITGEGSFDKAVLSEMLAENKQQIEEAESRLQAAEAHKDEEEERIRQLHVQYKNIQSWAEEFSQASPEEKKMILARIIRKITVDKEYQITIEFFVTKEDFMPQAQINGTDSIYLVKCN